MKKLLFLGLFFGLIGLVRARENFTFVPKPNTYASESVHLSSYTNSLTNAGQVFISSYSGFVHTVAVSSAGVGSTFELFDGNFTTTTARQIGYINTTSLGTYLYDVYCTSGIAIYNKGNPPAAVTVTYREK